jgi:putative transposase
LPDSQGWDNFRWWGLSPLDARGYCVFIERLWRSVKYEEVYLSAYENILTARASLGRYFEFYNTERRLQSLDRQTPDNVYY